MKVRAIRDILWNELVPHDIKDVAIPEGTVAEVEFDEDDWLNVWFEGDVVKNCYVPSIATHRLNVPKELFEEI